MLAHGVAIDLSESVEGGLTTGKGPKVHKQYLFWVAVKELKLSYHNGYIYI